MRDLLYILPLNGAVVPIVPIACDVKFDDRQQLIQWIFSNAEIPRGIEFTEYHYLLDENTAEMLNTSHLVFVYSKTKLLGYLPIGRIRAYDPIIVCTKEYRGFGNIKVAVATIAHIISTSMPEEDIGKNKTLDEMMKEYKSVDK